MLKNAILEKMNKKISFFYCFCTLVFSVTAVAAGNANLMEQEKDRVFLLNKEILMTLDGIDGNAKVSFSGSVVRGHDGKLQIKIDGVHNVIPYSPARSFSDRTKIEYVTFEEMLGKTKSNTPNSKVENEQPEQSSLMHGGGSSAQ